MYAIGMLGLHLIVSTYGFWPPNDPRGSWSKSVRAEHLYAVGGEATQVTTRRSVAHQPHNHSLRQQIKQAFKYPVVELSGEQALAVAGGIGDVSLKIDLKIHAFAILSNHFHIVTGAHHFEPKKLIACLQQSATRRLNKEGLHPLHEYPRANGKLPSPWAAGGWSVFLDTDDDMRRTITYVEQNPMKAGCKQQRWSFVESYER